MVKAFDQVTKLENVGNGFTDYISNAHIRHIPPRPKHLLEEDSTEEMFVPESGGAEVIPGKSYADATKKQCTDAQLSEFFKKKSRIERSRSMNKSRASTSSKSGKRPVQKSSRKRAQPSESSPKQYSKRSRTQVKPFQASMSGPSHD